jgi:transcriptional regulator with XRE-family HTH domain
MTPLSRLRRFLGLTQIDVENATGISVRRISLAEHSSIKLTDSEELAVSEYLAARLRIARNVQGTSAGGPERRSQEPRNAKAHSDNPVALSKLYPRLSGEADATEMNDAIAVYVRPNEKHKTSGCGHD